MAQVKPLIPVLLSVISGLIILSGGILATYMMSIWGGPLRHNTWANMLGQFGYAIGASTYLFGSFATMGIFGIFSGISILLSSLALWSKPYQHIFWGSIITVFSICSICGAMGGWIVGMILGIIGGLSAIFWKAPE